MQKKMEQEIIILTNNIDLGKQHVFSYMGSRIIFKVIGQKTWKLKAEGFERCGYSRRGRGERTVKFRYRVHLYTCVQKHKRKYRIFVL